MKVVAFDRSPSKLFMLRFSNKPVQIQSCERPKTTQRGVFLFCYLNTIIVSKHVSNVGLQHTFHIIRLTETTVLYS
jgi:hypothetical protein